MAVAVFFVSCEPEEEKMNGAIRKALESLRSGQTPMSADKKLANNFYHAVYRDDIVQAQKYLDAGADPNYCLGECGWVDANPLSVVAEGFYDTYIRREHKEAVPDPVPDVAMFNILIAAGANINQRPYIWNRVFIRNNEKFKRLKRPVKADNGLTESEAMKKQMDNYVEDANRLIEAFLKAGADPDKLGHPYPFSREAIYARITDEQANEYFDHGSRAINVAIEKGIAWESQVDLLLRYAKLDEESLAAAERSNDPVMVEKIQKLWKERRADEIYGKKEAASHRIISETNRANGLSKNSDIQTSFLAEYFHDGIYQILDQPLDVNYRKIYFAAQMIDKERSIADTVVGFEIQDGVFHRYLLIKNFCFINSDNSVLLDFSEGYPSIYGFNISFSYPKVSGSTPGLYIETFFDKGHRAADGFTIMWNEKNKKFEKSLW
jgi:hypothetical protein